MRQYGWRKVVCGLAVVLALSNASTASAAPFTFDTSALAGGALTLAFDLIDGDSTANTQVTIDSFDLGGGAVSGSPTYVGGATGDTAAGIVLSDSSFLNSFLQDFTAGTVLTFDVAFTGGGTVPPDGFAFSILSGGVPIATSDPTGANLLLFAEIGAGAPTIAQYAVPEPATWLLAAVAAASARWRRRAA
jgi:hypothetical protein